MGAATNLTTSGKATGSINSSTILAADSDGLGQQDPRTFGEASIDFDAIIPPGSTCTSFGSAYLKSRSSDSFSAATKDFIAPVSVSISNCATVIIKKETIPDKATGDFGFTHTLALIPASNSPFSLQDGGSTTFNNVVPTSGSTTYTVSEDDPTSDGFALTAIDCTSSDIARTFNKDVAARSASFGIAVGETITCTFTNTQQGKIIVKKVCNDADTTQNFQFTSSFSGGPGTLKCGEEKTSNSLAPGTYSVSEDVPAGWILVSSTCDDESAPSAINLGAGETVTCTFTNAKQRGAIKVTKTR